MHCVLCIERLITVLAVLWTALCVGTFGEPSRSEVICALGAQVIYWLGPYLVPVYILNAYLYTPGVGTFNLNHLYIRECKFPQERSRTWFTSSNMVVRKFDDRSFSSVERSACATTGNQCKITRWIQWWVEKREKFDIEGASAPKPWP